MPVVSTRFPSTAATRPAARPSSRSSGQDHYLGHARHQGQQAGIRPPDGRVVGRRASTARRTREDDLPSSNCWPHSAVTPSSTIARTASPPGRSATSTTRSARSGCSTAASWFATSARSSCQAIQSLMVKGYNDAAGKQVKGAIPQPSSSGSASSSGYSAGPYPRKWHRRVCLMPWTTVAGSPAWPHRRPRDASRSSRSTMPTVEATLPHLPAVVADMVRFQRLTGCRPGRGLQLRPCDVDRTGDVWMYTPASHKTEHHGRERVIYIGPKAQEIVAALSAAQCRRLLFLARGFRTKTARPPKTMAQDCSSAVTAKPPEVKAQTPALATTTIRTDTAKPSLGPVGRQASALGAQPTAPYRGHRDPQAVRPRRTAQVILGHSRADITQVYADEERAAWLGSRAANRGDSW